MNKSVGEIKDEYQEILNAIGIGAHKIRVPYNGNSILLGTRGKKPKTNLSVRVDETCIDIQREDKKDIQVSQVLADLRGRDNQRHILAKPISSLILERNDISYLWELGQTNLIQVYNWNDIEGFIGLVAAKTHQKEFQIRNSFDPAAVVASFQDF